MSLTFQVERWGDFYPDAKGLMQRHWEEIALDRERIPLALDEPRYESMDAAGILHVLTVREDGGLVGYFIAFILPHVHYSTSGKMAFTDIYFMMSECRKGTNGFQLFAEAEKSLVAAGVSKIYLSTKVHRDCGKIFESLGFTLTDRVFTKCYAGRVVPRV